MWLSEFKLLFEYDYNLFIRRTLLSYIEILRNDAGPSLFETRFSIKKEEARWRWPPFIVFNRGWSRTRRPCINTWLVYTQQSVTDCYVLVSDGFRLLCSLLRIVYTFVSVCYVYQNADPQYRNIYRRATVIVSYETVSWEWHLISKVKVMFSTVTT